MQFAKWKGAHVIGTASADHADYVRQLGANEVIDYRQTKFEEIVREVDVVLDTIGGDTQERSWGVLKRGGTLVSPGVYLYRMSAGSFVEQRKMVLLPK